MSVELPTQSPIGTFDRNRFMIVTQMDGSQKLYSRATKSGHHQVAPLNWWKKLGIFSDERDVWMKSVIHPEHVKLMKLAGIEASDLFSTVLSPSDTEDVLGWFNIFRAVYGRRPKTILEFRSFMTVIDSCKSGAEMNPLKLGRYAYRMQNTGLSLDAFIFAAGNDVWLDAIVTSVATLSDGNYLAPLIKTLMQIGGTPEALDVLTQNRFNSRSYGTYATKAVIAMFTSGEFSPSVDCYAQTRLLADALDAAPHSADCITELFFTEGTDRERLRNLIVVENVTDPLRLNAIFKEEVPTALVGGFL
jgi:hypothetical protein